jgi:plastocyanin
MVDPTDWRSPVKPRHASACLLVLAAVAVPVAGCGSSSGSHAAKSGGSPSQPKSQSTGGGSGSVSISNFKFTPASLTVSGTRIAVANRDSTAHTVTADDGHSFDTGNVDPGSSATVTVQKPGTYKYHCSIHPFMHGTFVVK